MPKYSLYDDEDEDLLFDDPDQPLANSPTYAMIDSVSNRGLSVSADSATRIASKDVRDIRDEEALLVVRAAVKRIASLLGFSLVNQTKIVTAASEIARNTLDYGGGGTVTMEIVERDGSRGLRLTFEDQGQGIPDIDLALKDGYTSGKGMGLGLGGSKRLVDEFDVRSTVGEGTKVTLTKWA